VLDEELPSTSVLALLNPSLMPRSISLPTNPPKWIPPPERALNLVVVEVRSRFPAEALALV
jgi:hypothetical protein